MNASEAQGGDMPTYRVPVVDDLQNYTGHPEQERFIQLRAPNALNARLLARYLSGAQVALEPTRLDAPAGARDRSAALDPAPLQCTHCSGIKWRGGVLLQCVACGHTPHPAEVA
jgi:hypothetical protein